MSDHDKVWANAIREGEILRESRQHCSDAVMYDLLDMGLFDDKRFAVSGKEASQSGEGAKLLPPINLHVRRYAAIVGSRLWRLQEKQQNQVPLPFSRFVRKRNRLIHPLDRRVGEEGEGHRD